MLHILTLLNLRFGRYRFDGASTCYAMLRICSTFCTAPYSTKFSMKKKTTGRNVVTKKQRMPNNLYYSLYKDVTVSLSVTIYFTKCSTKQIGCDQLNRNKTPQTNGNVMKKPEWTTEILVIFYYYEFVWSWRKLLFWGSLHHSNVSYEVSKSLMHN